MFQALDWSLFFRSGLIFSTKPGYIVLSWGPVKESLTSFKEENSWSFFCPDFYLKTPKYLQFKHNIECSTAELWAFLKEDFNQNDHNQNNQNDYNNQNISRSFSDLDFSLFKKKFDQIQSEIEKKVLSKAVPVIFQKSNKPFNLLEKKHLLKSLLDPSNVAVNKSLHIYGLFLNAQGILGASPEVLFSYNKKNKTLKSMALAGTDLCSAEKNSLLSSVKNLEEHDIVAKYLNTTLSNLAEKESFIEGKTYEWSIGHLKHLRKDFQIFLSNFNLKKIIKLFHPTPALGTSPQGQWTFLQKIDASMDRLQYGAPFVVTSPEGNSKAVVAIRNIQWTNTGLWLFVGCGIIKKSNVQTEFQELNNKIKSVKLLLGLINE